MIYSRSCHNGTSPPSADFSTASGHVSVLVNSGRRGRHTSSVCGCLMPSDVQLSARGLHPHTTRAAVDLEGEGREVGNGRGAVGLIHTTSQSVQGEKALRVRDDNSTKRPQAIGQRV